MICKKCGKEVQDGTNFCPFCGNNLSRTNQHINETDGEETLPLFEIINKIKSHKKISIIVLTTVVLLIGTYFGLNAYNRYKEKKELQEAQDKHLSEIVGTYRNLSTWNKITITLSRDKTATLILNENEYNEKKYKGYWEEKVEDTPIEIEFYESFDISVGKDRDKYCRTLYFFAGTLWTSYSAIRSQDLEACELMLKE